MSYPSSEIENQAVVVEQLLLPLAVGAATNISPSLVPYTGALCQDPTTPGTLYVANGSDWIPIQSGGTSSSVTGVTLSNSGQPSFTGCSVLLTKLDSTTSNKVISIYVAQTITVTAAGLWSSPAGIVTGAYVPVNGQLSLQSCVITTSAGVINTYLSIAANGSVGIYSPATSGSLTINSVSSSYI